MTKKTTTPKKTENKSKKEKTPVVTAANRRTEWRFDLPLDTIVKGNLPAG